MLARSNMKCGIIVDIKLHFILYVVVENNDQNTIKKNKK